MRLSHPEMFTGIIENTGVVESIRVDREEGVLKLSAPKLSARVKPGSSVSVDGVCLTVRAKKGRWLTFDLSAETLQRSSLGKRRPRDRVNLETSLTLSRPLDGHLVQGHVDAVGRLERSVQGTAGRILEISIPQKLARFITEKGSVAVDGVSLTSNWVNGTRFRVMIIPYTARHTTLGSRRVGDFVNIETDVVAKYLSRWMS